MPNAKVTIATQDLAAIIPALAGISIGTVINADWGPITPFECTQPSDLLNTYSKPNNAKGSSWNGAELLLASSSSVYVNRAIHADAAYSAALVRFITNPDNFNIYQTPGTVPDPVVLAVPGGISLTGLASYEFPLYSTNVDYEDMGQTVFYDAANATTLVFSGLTSTGTSGHTLEAGDNIAFGTGPLTNSTPFYTVASAAVETVVQESIALDSNVSVLAGAQCQKWNVGTSTATPYNPPVYATYDQTLTPQVIVAQCDAVINGDVVTFDGGTTHATVTAKDISNVQQSIVVLETPVTVTALQHVQYMIHGDTELRDAFLAVALYPGALGQNIKIGIRASTNYPGVAFWVDVYWQGALSESFECTRTQYLDGYGNQLYIGNVINGISKYIQIVDNIQDTTKSIPLPTTFAVWQQDPIDLFPVTTATTIEDVLQGDVLVTVSDPTRFTLNCRIQFTPGGSQYHVSLITGSTLTLDRGLVETKVATGSAIYEFNAATSNPTAGIFDGTQYFKWTQLATTLPGNNIGDQYVISSVAGSVLDAGTNSFAGGSDGSAVTLYDVINAFNAFSNAEEYKISVFCDNGFAYPEVAIALDSLCVSLDVAHNFSSTTYTSELAVDPVAAVVAYRNSTNLNSAYSSIFTGWIQVTDVYNQTNVWVAPSVFGVNAQSFVTKNYQIFTPAAGWVYGRLNGLNIAVKYDDGQRDTLVDARINPIRYRQGSGLVVWGNETTYVSPSPLQLRSVAMLLIVLKYGLQQYLENILFGENASPTWTTTKDQIDIFIRDTLFTPGGLYGWQTTVAPTGTDINNRRMPVKVLLQPTEDIQTIPVTLGILNATVSLTTA
jgi:hypothetical protein